MTKAELVSYIASESSITKKAAELALDSLVTAVRTTISSEGEIRVPDLGTFKVIERKARAGVNPQTGKKITIPATKTPVFRASKSLKEAAKKSK